MDEYLADADFFLELYKNRIVPNKNWLIKFGICGVIKSLDNPKFFTNHNAILELAIHCKADDCIETLLKTVGGTAPK